MATHGAFFVAPVPGAPPVGMSATDGRLALAGIFGTSAQLVSGGGVSQSGSNMQFTVAAGVWQLADVTNAAATFFAATDATVLTPAVGPGSGSRKDLICVRAHNYENGDADSQTAVVLVAGTAGSPGVDPAVPAGYYKYAEIAVPTAAATAAACTVTIYGNTTFAPPDLQAPTLALLNTVTGTPGQQGTVTADGNNNGLYQYFSSWQRVSSGVTQIVPTAVNTGGAVAVNPVTGEVTGSGAITALRINSSVAVLSQFKYIEFVLRYDGTTAGSHAISEALAAVIDATAGSYFVVGSISTVTGTPASTASGGTTSWTQGYVGNRNKRRVVIRLYNMADAINTTVEGSSVDTNGGGSLVQNVFSGEHSLGTPQAFDGLNVALTGLGTISNLSVVLRGHS